MGVGGGRGQGTRLDTLSAPHPQLRFSRVDVMDTVRLLAPDTGMALVGLVPARLGHELARPPGSIAPSPFAAMDHEEDETARERDSMELGRRRGARRWLGPRALQDAEWPSRQTMLSSSKRISPAGLISTSHKKGEMQSSSKLKTVHPAGLVSTSEADRHPDPPRRMWLPRRQLVH